MTGPESPHPVPAADLPGARLEHALRQRKTPLLRIAGAAGAGRGEGLVLAKLESLRPAGCIDDRALGAWDDALAASQARAAVARSADFDPQRAERQGAPDSHRAAPSGSVFFARLPSSAVLAGAGWARARGISLRAIVHGPVTHEVSETLLLWGAQVVRAGSRSEAEALAKQAAAEGLEPLPPLDGSLAAQAVERSLGAELVEQLREEKISEERVRAEKVGAGNVGAEKVGAGTHGEAQRGAALVAPISAGLAGAFSALRASFPRLRGYALCAATQGDLLPELPSRGEAEALLAELAAHWGQGALELVPIARAQAQQARMELARSHGLSASHASAAAVAHALALCARDPSALALALVTATGEREFSLDPAR